MGESRGSRCTRSRAAPDWTAEESLILVNEIYAVESEWGTTLPSFQKWKQIVENCNALEVSRNLNQCKRKWDELLAEYRRVKHESAARARATATADVSFPVDLFNAIDMCVGAKGRKCGGGAAALAVTEDEEAEAEEEEQVAMATDPDSDPEAQGRATEFFLETGTKKQRPRMKRQKRKLETLNPWGYSTSANIKHEEECSNVNEKQNITAITHEHEERSAETKEQIMATMLWENALQINAILEGNIADETDYKLADLKNAEAVEIDFTRLQALSDDTAFAKSLIKFKQSLVNPIKLDNWIEPVDKLCSWNTPIWKGCLCANGSFMGLKLENMGLSGVIDVESLAELPLLSLSLMNNNFSGPFPSGINKLVKLRSLFLANNRFSGEISDDAFVGMKGMRKVVMGNNGFSGRIPMSLLGLPKLVDLEIQNNRFVGRIPDFWQEDLSVDFSNNDLEGVIPATLVNRNATSFLGNKNLCGKPLEPCKQNKPIKKIAFVLSAVIGFSLVIAFTALILLRRNRSKPLKYQKSIDNFQIEAPYYSNNNENKNSKKRATTNNYKTSTNFENGKLYFVRNDRERFELDELLRASAEVLGSGSFGSSYKALLRSGYPYVVRRFRQMNNAGKEDFCQHLTKLGKLKHVNLLPVVAFYYRKEEKLLITDFVENGSLASHLHGKRDPNKSPLNWATRLKIIKGVARGLSHLYKEFPTLSLPHGHLKSSNVLLTAAYDPLLSDYALSLLINKDHAHQFMVAHKSPESAQNDRVSRKTDVWSLGILILELITGRFPANYLKRGRGPSADLANWVNSVVAEELTADDVFDKEMGLSRSGGAEMTMVRLLRIGMCCCEWDVEKRWDLRMALQKIEEIDCDGDGDDDDGSSYAASDVYYSSRAMSSTDDEFPFSKS